MMPRVRANLPLALVLLLALALRLWGIGWGLPSATHYFSYHPDESMVLLYAMSMNVFQGHLLPHFYNYGSLQLYLVLLANTLFFVFGHGALIVQNYATQTSQWAQQFLVGRLLTVGMGVGTVWATYALGRCIWGIRAGLAGALILAILPLHVQHSHWLTVDVPATFWATISLVWSARLLTGDPKPLRAALLAGMFAGFAIATKYNLALALLPLAFAALCPPASSVSDEPRPRRKYLVAGILGCVAAALAFLVTCPGVFLEWPVFLGGIRYEAYHVQHLPDLAFLDTGNGFLYQIRTNFDAGLGLPLLVLCACALGYALWRRERGDGLLAAFALPYFLVISLAEVRYARYIIPLLPILAVWSGRVLAELSRGARIPLGKAALALAGAALLLTLGDCVWLIRPMAAPDNRDVALAQILRMNPASVGFATQPWYGEPPVSPWFCDPRHGYWRLETAPVLQAKIIYTHDWDTAALTTLRPPVVVLNEFDYQDRLRLRRPLPVAYVHALEAHYTLTRVISGPNRPNGMVDGLPERDLPPDMMYTNPIILIYTRK